MKDTQSVSNLQPPTWNPRRIKEFDFSNLTNSIKEFGDVSGIVKNLTTSNLPVVCGLGRYCILAP